MEWYRKVIPVTFIVFIMAMTMRGFTVFTGIDA
jgi:hypothetical protein